MNLFNRSRLLCVCAITAFAAPSFAATYCSVSHQTIDGGADRTLFATELKGTHTVAVAADGQSAREVDLNQLKTVEAWKSLNGSSFVVFALDRQGSVTVSVSKIDATNIKNSRTLIKMKALATGPVAPNKPLALLAPEQNISASCAVAE